MDGRINKKMRIAIQIAGHLRTFKHLEHSLYENVIKYNEDKGHQIDVFMFTVYKKDDTIPPFQLVKPMMINYIDDDKVFMNNVRSEEDIQNRIEWLYKHHYLQFFRMVECNRMRQSYEKYCEIEYDIVFRTRFDLIYYNPVEFDKPLDNRRIYVANERHEYGTPSDVCWYCKPAIANELLEMYTRHCRCPHTPLNSFDWVKYMDVDVVRSVDPNNGQYTMVGPKIETSSFDETEGCKKS
jgi:hypothetical protein